MAISRLLWSPVTIGARKVPGKIKKNEIGHETAKNWLSGRFNMLKSKLPIWILIFWYRNWPEISKNCQKWPKTFFYNKNDSWSKKTKQKIRKRFGKKKTNKNWFFLSKIQKIRLKWRGALARRPLFCCVDSFLAFSPLWLHLGAIWILDFWIFEKKTSGIWS